MPRPEKIERSELLRRATALFWDRGCDAVSTRDLEAALGIRAPALYRRFPSKDALLAQCLDDYVERVIKGRIRRHLDRAEDPVEGLYAFFMSTLDTHPSAPERRGCLLAHTAAHSEAQIPEIRSAITRGWNHVEAGFKESVIRAQGMDLVDSSLDPDALARALFLSLMGLLALTRVGKDDLRPAIEATFQILRARTPEPQPPKPSPSDERGANPRGATR
ncbi:MAG: TetR/AcrR family transcriptional regulator [Myxococcota bacterium]